MLKHIALVIAGGALLACALVAVLIAAVPTDTSGAARVACGVVALAFAIGGVASLRAGSRWIYRWYQWLGRYRRGEATPADEPR